MVLALPYSFIQRFGSWPLAQRLLPHLVLDGVFTHRPSQGLAVDPARLPIADEVAEVLTIVLGVALAQQQCGARRISTAVCSVRYSSRVGTTLSRYVVSTENPIEVPWKRSVCRPTPSGLSIT